MYALTSQILGSAAAWCIVRGQSIRATGIHVRASKQKEKGEIYTALHLPSGRGQVRFYWNSTEGCVDHPKVPWHSALVCMTFVLQASWCLYTQ